MMSLHNYISGWDYNPKTLKKLANGNANLEELAETYGDKNQTPLAHAVENGNLKAVKILIDAGAKVNS